MPDHSQGVYVREGSLGDRFRPDSYDMIRARCAIWTDIFPYFDHSQLALGQIHELNLLHGDCFTSAPIESFIDRAKGSFSKALSQSLLTHMSPVSLFYYSCSFCMYFLGTYIVFQPGILHGLVTAIALLSGGIWCTIVSCWSHRRRSEGSIVRTGERRRTCGQQSFTMGPVAIDLRQKRIAVLGWVYWCSSDMV